MAGKKPRDENLFVDAARRLLDSLWDEVSSLAESARVKEYVDDPRLRSAITDSVNHSQVSYRFCLPVQLLGKLVNPSLDALSLQRGDSSRRPGAWDARSLASKVVAPFNRARESVLGTSADPYVGNPMRVPRMVRDDASKKGRAGRNVLIDVLEAVQQRDDIEFTETVFKQVLLDIHRRQSRLQFSYAIPLRVSLESVIRLSREFLSKRSGGDRALALAGALFDVIGASLGLYTGVNRARINASDLASGQAADLECVDAGGRVVLAVEVKDRALTLADVEGTIGKTRHRSISEVLFAAPQTAAADENSVQQRIATAYASSSSNLQCVWTPM